MATSDRRLPPLVEPTGLLTPAEHERYSRHVVIPNVGIEGQLRLKQARVLCIGAGGLGSPVLMYLAAAGVGTIGIVEFDVVDSSNLQRQIIHGIADIGTSKAQSARRTMLEVNPFIDVVPHEVRLDAGNALEIFADYDLIVDGTDNFATRYLVNDACVLLDLPYVWGSIYRFEGQASVFWSAHGPCYRCLYPEPPPPGLVPSCAEGGVLGVLCASIGAIQATEAIKLITGLGDSLVGRLMVYDALQMQYRNLAIARDPDCAVCGQNPSVTALVDYEVFCGTGPTMVDEPATISAPTLSRMLMERERGERDFLLIDVREPAEYAIVAIDGARLIPQGAFLDGSVLGTLPRDLPIVLHCKLGIRSATCARVLLDAGFEDVQHLEGGIIDWVNRIEPHKPRY